MRVVAVVSAKGGVGKTTVTANLACAMALAGRNVLVVDLDPQNALRLHLGLAPPDLGGVSRATLAGEAWARHCVVGRHGVAILPYGRVNEADRRRFEAHIDADDSWLRRHLDSLGLPRDTCVLIDTPPGPSVYLRQALVTANAAIVVTLPDAASYATLPMMDMLIHDHCAQRSDFEGARYVINQVDGSAQLAVDVAQVMRRDLGDRVLGTIHRDQSVPEALAYDSSVIDYRGDSRAAHDFVALSRAFDGAFGGSAIAA